MPEKVKIKSVKVKREGTGQKGPYKIYDIELHEPTKQGGYTHGDSFQEFTEGEECEIEIKPNSNPQYAPSFSKVGAAKKGFGAAKDYTFEKKRVALECTTALIAAGKVEMKNLAECRDKFFAYLNEK